MSDHGQRRPNRSDPFNEGATRVTKFKPFRKARRMDNISFNSRDINRPDCLRFQSLSILISTFVLVGHMHMNWIREMK